MTLFVSVAGRPQDPASAEEAAEALRDSETGIAPDLLAEVAEAIRGSALGVMLYGSQAPGSADESSDVDVASGQSSRGRLPRVWCSGLVCTTRHSD